MASDLARELRGLAGTIDQRVFPHIAWPLYVDQVQSLKLQGALRHAADALEARPHLPTRTEIMAALRGEWGRARKYSRKFEILADAVLTLFKEGEQDV